MQYMGSKARFRQYIVPIIQDCIDKNGITNYIEPFVGGANIIDSIVCEKKIGADINKYLISLLTYVRDNDLSNLPNAILFKEYDAVRKSYRNNDDSYEDWYKGFIGFCGSYGSRFYDGGYARNSAWDDTGERTKSAIKNLKQQAPNLKGIEFKCLDYLDWTDKIHNSVVYLDPPYRGTKRYDYHKIYYHEFYDFCRHLKENGNHIFVSEYEMPDDFTCLWEKQTSTTINQKSKGEANSRVERLFTLQ